MKRKLLCKYKDLFWIYNQLNYDLHRGFPYKTTKL